MARVKVFSIALAAAVCAAQKPATVAANRLSGDVRGTAAAAVSQTAQQAAIPGEYRIGAGDLLGIEVWKEPDASSPAAPVRPDGKMSLPIVGEVQAAGLTPIELQDVLRARYKEYIRDARVNVVVKEINSQKAYLIGEVKREGPVRLSTPMTVLQALAEAGGLTDFAKRKGIYIMRTVQNRRVLLPFDYDAVVKGEKVEENVTLVAGDTVVVPR
jgi:polysaccharide export outer membrane protein